MKDKNNKSNKELFNFETFSYSLEKIKRVRNLYFLYSLTKLCLKGSYSVSLISRGESVDLNVSNALRTLRHDLGRIHSPATPQNPRIGHDGGEFSSKILRIGHDGGESLSKIRFSWPKFPGIPWSSLEFPGVPWSSLEFLYILVRVKLAIIL